VRIFLLFLALNAFADNEIFVEQSGSNAAINLEQLGSSNLIGGTSAVSGTMTALDLDGINMTLEINQIGASNIFRSDAFDSDYISALFDFQGDSNVMDILVNSGGAYTADYADFNIQVTGGSNTFEGSGYAGTTSSDSGYFYLDLTGDSNTYTITQASTLARDYLKITSNASNSVVCIVQSDGSSTTSC
jgi:hypothetical protein